MSNKDRVELGWLRFLHAFFKRTQHGVGQDSSCSRKKKTTGKAREEVPGWVRAGLSVDVALQEQISWEEGRRSCLATQGNNNEQKYHCSAPVGIAKSPSLASPAWDGFCPFVPRQISLGWNVVAAPQLGQDLVLVLEAAGMELQLSAVS